MSDSTNEQIKGEWLRKAIKAQGTTFSSTAQALKVRPDRYSKHARGKSLLSAESLAELARLYPTMNMRYVLTGEGDPII